MFSRKTENAFLHIFWPIRPFIFQFSNIFVTHSKLWRVILTGFLISREFFFVTFIYCLFKLEALILRVEPHYWAEKIKSQWEHPKVKCVNLIGESECSVARSKICKTTKNISETIKLVVFWPVPSGNDISFSVIQHCLAVLLPCSSQQYCAQIKIKVSKNMCYIISEVKVKSKPVER